MREIVFRMTVPGPHSPSPEERSNFDEVDGFELIDGTTAVVRSKALRELMQMLRRVAQQNAAVLVLGETGSGKELVAQAIHHFSRRASRTFVDVNCAALPEHLVESELFGYEKGAFSGAESVKPGLFEVADGGTLFLDEVGELDARVQVKLLRVLDGAPYYRLGGNRKISVDARIVAATNQDLEAAVRSGKFRRDLYYRLSQFLLCVPPLRNRPEDIVAIAQHLLRKHRAESRFTGEALEALQNYDWPGNVRELKNVVFKTVMQSEHTDNEIGASDLAIPISTSKSTGPIEARSTTIDEVEKQLILDTLNKNGGHRGRAAEQLGVSRRTLTRKLKLYRLESAQVAASALGALSYEQQRYFRVTAQLPVTIRANNKEFHATTVNLSRSGIALYSEDIVDFRSIVDLSFTLPSNSCVIDAKAQMAWVDSDGKAGFRFLDMASKCREELDTWLVSQIATEGWTAEPAVAHL